MSLSDSSPGCGCIFSRLSQVGTADLDPGRPGLQEITALHSLAMGGMASPLCPVHRVNAVFSPAVMAVSW